MRTRNFGLIGMGTIALMLIGCAHTTNTAPRITYVPDSFTPEVQQAQPGTAMEKVAKKRQAIRSSVTTGRASIGAAAMLTESGKAESAKSKGHASQTKSFRNGKKGNPALLNLPKLIKMGGFAKLYGAADEPESGSGNMGVESTRQKRLSKSMGKTMADRARVAVRKKQPPMLNLPMLLKMGGFAKMADGYNTGRKKGNPGLLNLSMLIKMGGFARMVEKSLPTKPSMRRPPAQKRSHAMRVPSSATKRESRTKWYDHGVNPSLFNRRQHLGGRCFGPNCSN